MKNSKPHKSTDARKANLRRITFDVLRAENKPSTFEGLSVRVAKILRTNDGTWKPRGPLMDAISPVPQSDPGLDDDETDMLREIYWDLFRERIITLGRGVHEFSIHSEAPEF